MNTKTSKSMPVGQVAAVLKNKPQQRSFLYRFLHGLQKQLFAISVIVILILGWGHRDSNYLSAETGAGYALGIIGTSMMLILLLYPLSKRVKTMTRLIPIRYWFGFHMTLGVVGPVMVLFHSNFHLGSTNSTVAMFCMLTVAGSGLIGRYIYTRIHHGLYGTKISLNELRQETNADHIAINSIEAIDTSLETDIKKLEAASLQIYTNIFSSLWYVSTLGMKSRRLKKRIVKAILASNTANKKQAVSTATKYLLKLRQIAAFQVYERLFSLWHVLHLPLFFMMIIAAIIHVFAVHMY
jgi:hypothetical protein